MDQREKEERQKEFTLYLILFILLVIVGAIQSQNGRQARQAYWNPRSCHPYDGYPINPYQSHSYGYHPHPYAGTTPFGWW